MSTVNKRTLSLKSKLGFGKYDNLIIDDIIKLNKSDYLRYIYFNYEIIDFIPEILDTIQIPIEYRLIKPSINHEFLEIVNSNVIESHRFVFQNTEEAKEKRIIVQNTFKNKFNINKKLLLRKNHGH